MYVFHNGTFRRDHEYEIKYEYNFPNLVHTLVNYHSNLIPTASHQTRSWESLKGKSPGNEVDLTL